MQTRRETLKHSAAVAGLLAGAGLLPQSAWAYNKNAFEAKNLAEATKALGVGMPVESKDVTIGAPDIAENGAVVPIFGTVLPVVALPFCQPKLNNLVAA